MKTHLRTSRRRIRVGLWLTITLPGCSAAALGPALPPACADGTTQAELDRCASSRTLTAQELLDALVGELAAKLSATEGSELRDVQSRWEAARTATCQAESDLFFGGTPSPAAQARCVEDMTWDRIDHLRFFLCEGAGATEECADARRYAPPDASGRLA